MVKNAFRYLLAVAMIAVGISHFANPEPFVRIVPAYLPAPLILVYVSGIFECLGGVGLLVPKVRRAAAWGLVALYVAVFPANLNMAMNHVYLDPSHPIPDFALWLRLPVQAVLIAWAWWFTKADRASAPLSGEMK